MNRSSSASRANAPYPALPELQNLEREARRLRVEYARNLLARLAIVFGLQVRRLTHRVARLRLPGGAPTSAVR
jgi:hypothetical protein